MTSEEGGSSSRSKKHARRSSSSASQSNGNVHRRSLLELDSRDSSSPAPTTLPWFAEDLSPEDLALVHRAGGRASTSSLKLDVREAETTLEEDDVQRKKRVILGGEELSQEKQEPGTYIAIDCEMVGVGPNGTESILARVSIVNWHGAVLLDTFVKPRERVTDYRTWVSGVRPENLYEAPSFESVQTDVAKLIKGRVLIGHAIHNDLKALLLSHPRPLIRDTASNKFCRELANTKFPSLKKLVLLRLGIDIQKQGSEHCPVEDARATMALYRTLHADWQKSISTAIIGRGWKKNNKKRKEPGNGGSPPSQSNPNGKEANGFSVKSTKQATSDPDWWKHV